MKRIQISFFTVLALTVLSFTACKKEDIKDNGPQVQNWARIVVLSDIENGKCVSGTGLCLSVEQVDPNNAPEGPLGTNELLAEPILANDNAVTFHASIPATYLSADAEYQLVERQFLNIQNDIAIDEAIVRQAWENAGKIYDGQTVTIGKGVYNAWMMKSYSGNGTLELVRFCISGSNWRMCIDITY